MLGLTTRPHAGGGWVVIASARQDDAFREGDVVATVDGTAFHPEDPVRAGLLDVVVVREGEVLRLSACPVVVPRPGE